MNKESIRFVLREGYGFLKKFKWKFGVLTAGILMLSIGSNYFGSHILKEYAAGQAVGLGYPFLYLLFIITGIAGIFTAAFYISPKLDMRIFGRLLLIYLAVQLAASIITGGIAAILYYVIRMSENHIKLIIDIISGFIQIIIQSGFIVKLVSIFFNIDRQFSNLEYLKGIVFVFVFKIIQSGLALLGNHGVAIVVRTILATLLFIVMLVCMIVIMREEAAIDE